MTESTPWFGMPPLPEATMAWGARAIFERGELDFLPNRQGFKHSGEQSVKPFIRFVNKKVIPWMRRAARLLSSDSSRTFTKHFDFEGQVVVVVMSPRASYGYLYVAVSLVPASCAPAEDCPVVPARSRRLR